MFYRRLLKASCFMLIAIFAVSSPLYAEDDRSRFDEAISNDDMNMLLELIASGADVDARDERGWTPLMRAAAYNGDPDIIKTLLDAGADVNARDNLGFTPLMHAVPRFNSNSDMIIALLDAGADAKAKDIYGKRAVDYAKDNSRIYRTNAYWTLNDASF